MKPKTQTGFYRLEELDPPLSPVTVGLPDLPLDGLILSGRGGEQTLGGGTQQWNPDGEGAGAGGAGGADIILALLLQEESTTLTDPHTVTVEPFLTAVTADHEPECRGTFTHQHPDSVLQYIHMSAKH